MRRSWEKKKEIKEKGLREKKRSWEEKTKKRKNCERKKQKKMSWEKKINKRWIYIKRESWWRKKLK